jgi:hypothetical protein
MSPDKSRASDQDPSPFCPQCGSDETAPIHPQPPPKGAAPPDPRAKEAAWFRCLTCRHKWKEED